MIELPIYFVFFIVFGSAFIGFVLAMIARVGVWIWDQLPEEIEISVISKEHDEN